MGKKRSDKGVEAILSTLKQVFAHTKAFLLTSEDQMEQRNMVLARCSHPIQYEQKAMAAFAEF